MKALADRIALVKEQTGWSNAELARRAGTSRAAPTDWLNGKVRALSSEVAQRLSSNSEYSATWLATGSGSPKSKLAAMDESNVVGVPAGGRVPLISWVQAGDWCEAIDTFHPGDAEDWLFCPAKHSGSTFALRVRGVSMEPKYRDGAVIYVDPERSADHLSNVVVRLADENEVTFKQLVIEGSKRFLRPLNPDWPGDKLMQIDSTAYICGVVIGQFIED